MYRGIRRPWMSEMEKAAREDSIDNPYHSAGHDGFLHQYFHICHMLQEPLAVQFEPTWIQVRKENSSFPVSHFEN